MIARYNNISLALGAPGIILQIVGQILRESPQYQDVGRLLLVLGTGLLLVGLAFYAKAKGRHPAWRLMAFLSLIGLIVLASLKDHATANDQSRAE
jgi:RsiW-degrading membrane proteinase PrsW (M82 family)